MPEGTFNDRTHAALSLVSSVGFDLLALSGALHETGNSLMAERLKAFAATLDFAVNEMDEALDSKLAHDLGASFEASTNVLRAAMAGLAVGSGQKPPHDLPLGPVTAVEVIGMDWIGDH